MPAKKCPVLTFKVEEARPGRIEIFALAGKRVLGGIGATVRRRDGREPARLQVDMVEVNPKDQRCGIGTRLYEEAAKHACTRKLVLASDVNRTGASQGFWAKQAAKKRAKCFERNDHMPGGCLYYVLKPCAVTSLAGARSRRKRKS